MLLFSIFLACSDQETSNKEPAAVEQKAEHQHKQQDTKHQPSKDAKDHSHAKTDKSEQNAAIAEVPEGAKVFFVSPADGAKVTSPVAVKMGIEGMTVKPAGELENGTGHHHIIIDADSVAKGAVVPADDKHKHFGKGQTETTLELQPGEHTLRLQFADGIHRSYGPKMEQAIKITVTK